MKRYVSLEEISDGRLYGTNDMVKADCMGCKDCSKCCHGMGDSIILDPCDVYRLQKGTGRPFSSFLEEGTVALGVVDGVVLPHLVMLGDEEKCGFLNGDGRCAIHAWRPGLCRLFPLGRYYEQGTFRYFLQKSECDHPKAKVKVAKWLDLDDLARYEAFVTSWHDLFLQAQELPKDHQESEEFRKELDLIILQLFYLQPYEMDKSFYEQYEMRSGQYRVYLKDT